MVTLCGDPLLKPTLKGLQKAKNQSIMGVDNQDTTLFCDVRSITQNAKGGADVLVGGNNSGHLSFDHYV